MFNLIELKEHLIRQQQLQQWKEQDKDTHPPEQLHHVELLLQEIKQEEHLPEHKQEEIHQEEQEIHKGLWLQVKWLWKEHVKEIPQEDLKVEETQLVEHLPKHKQEEIHQ